VEPMSGMAFPSPEDEGNQQPPQQAVGERVA
jgi:hypothetical protein